MSTETKSKSETVVTASTALVALIIADIEAQASAESARVKLAKGIKSEAERNGYDRDEARTMVVLSYRQARKFKSDDKAEIAKFDRTYASRVSTVMALAYPANDAAATELANAIAMNDKAGAKRDRIGENKLIEIARGKLTLAEVQEGKTATRTPSTPSNLPLSEQIGNAIAGLFAKFEVTSEPKLVEFESAVSKAVAIKRKAFAEKVAAAPAAAAA